MTKQTRSRSDVRRLLAGLAAAFVGVSTADLLVAGSAGAAGVTRYVAADGSATSDCTNPADPCELISYAITAAGDGDTISIGPGTFTESARLYVGRHLEIRGAGQGLTVIAPPTNSAYTVGIYRNTVLRDLTVQGGDNSAIQVSQYALELNNVTVSGGTIGIFVDASSATPTALTVANSTITGTGQGIQHRTDGKLTVTGSTFINPGMYGITVVLDGASVSITNTTISGASTGISIRETSATITRSTITDSTSRAIDTSGTGKAYLAGSILQNNMSCYGSIVDDGYNLDNTSTCLTASTSLKGTNARLSPLADNGGATQTLKPASDSPAVDKIPLGHTLCSGTDQRGVTRPQGVGCDIGAVELRQPKITTQPQSQAVADGATVTLTATVTGTAGYQWESRPAGGEWGPVDGATAPSLTLPSMSMADHLSEFRVRVWDEAPLLSEVAIVGIEQPPAVTTQPVSKEVVAPAPVTLTVAGTGYPAPGVQWQGSETGSTWSNLSGETGLTLTPNTEGDLPAWQYRAVLTNTTGTAISDPATVTVLVVPTITLQPVPTTVLVGVDAEFVVAGSGRPTPTVQWQTSADGAGWTDIEGATANRLPVTAAADNAGHRFRAVLTNSAATATSEAAVLTVHQEPAITRQPTDVTVDEGEVATFEAASSGLPTPTIRWEVKQVDGDDWATTSTGPTLTVPTAGTPGPDGCQYRAVATNAAGSVTSEEVTLTVRQKPRISVQPSAVTATVGMATVTFTADASSNVAPIAIQWWSSTGTGTWTALDDQTNTTLEVPVTPDLDGTYFRATFTNAVGSTASAQARLTVLTLPAFVSTDQATFVPGTSGSFEITATGSPVPTLTFEGDLPDGVMFTSTGAGHGTLSGMTMAPGSYPLTLTATNSSGTASQELIVTVEAIPTVDLPEFAPTTPPADPNAIIDAPESAVSSHQLTVTASGFAPFAPVTLGIYSAPTMLGVGTADANGDVTFTVTVPTGFSGNHTIVAVGMAADGSELALYSPIVVSAPAFSSIPTAPMDPPALDVGSPVAPTGPSGPSTTPGAARAPLPYTGGNLLTGVLAGSLLLTTGVVTLLTSVRRRQASS